MAETRHLEVFQHDAFRNWLSTLRDARAQARIAACIRRLEMGNPGDVKPLGDGVSEMRIRYGPGYRVYYNKLAAPSSSCSVVATRAARTET